MRAVLEFEFPEDESEYRHAISGFNYYRALDDLAELFRKHEKYDAPAPTRQDFYEVLAEYGVELGVEV